MESATNRLCQLTAQSRDIARQLLVIGENRLELLKVEMQEERDLLLRSFLLAFGAAVVVLLAGIALTSAIIVWLWAYSPAGILLALTVLYVVAGFFLYRRLTGLFRDRGALPGTFEQFRKDPSLFGKSPGRDRHESRKQMLIAESEINRAHLADDLTALQAGIGNITDRTRSIGSIAASAAGIVTDLAALRREKLAGREAKFSWLPTMLKGVGLVSGIWLALRQGRREPDHR
jgi:uncharacterized membrane protein YqjE